MTVIRTWNQHLRRSICVFVTLALVSTDLPAQRGLLRIKYVNRLSSRICHICNVPNMDAVVQQLLSLTRIRHTRMTHELFSCLADAQPIHDNPAYGPIQEMIRDKHGITGRTHLLEFPDYKFEWYTVIFPLSLNCAAGATPWSYCMHCIMGLFELSSITLQ
jgi:hypothetical protein